jgi:hypothetical protein
MCGRRWSTVLKHRSVRNVYHTYEPCSGFGYGSSTGCTHPPTMHTDYGGMDPGTVYGTRRRATVPDIGKHMYMQILRGD